MFKRPAVEEIIEVLSANREEVLTEWRRNIQDVCARMSVWFPIEGGAPLPISMDELGDFLAAYLDDLRRGGSEHSEQFVIRMVERKIAVGCSLAFLELINSTFADVVRRIIQMRFPDSFDSRARYMEWIAELVSRNDLRLALEYEMILARLNGQVMARQRELEQHNAIMQEFFDAAAHEFQAPLWSILGFATKLLDQHGAKLDPKGLHALARIQENVREMHLLIQGFARILNVNSLAVERVRLPLLRVIRSAIVRLRKEVGRDCEIQLGDDFPVIWGDFRQIETMFYELLRNGVLYVPDDRTALVRVTSEQSGDPGRCCIQVADNGIGIPPDYSNLVWRPLERLNDIRVEGLGLGLTYVRRVVEVHGGDVRFVSNGLPALPGTCVEIQLPLVAAG